MINLKINNMPVQVEAGTTILEAAKSIGIKIFADIFQHRAGMKIIKECIFRIINHFLPLDET